MATLSLAGLKENGSTEEIRYLAAATLAQQERTNGLTKRLLLHHHLMELNANAMEALKIAIDCAMVCQTEPEKADVFEAEAEIKLKEIEIRNEELQQCVSQLI